LRPQDSTTRPLVGFHSFTPYEKPEADPEPAATTPARREPHAHNPAAGLEESFRVLNQLIAGADNPPNANARTGAATESPDTQQFIAHVSTPRPRRRRPRLDLRGERKPRKTLAEMSALERHERKCQICRHRDREEIESDFLHWHDVSDLVIDYKLPNRRTLYRHARATGLFELRMANIRDAAALIAARAEHAKATASSVLKAIQACSQIDELGRWIEPPKQLVRYTVIGSPESAESQLPSAREAAPSSPEPTAAREISNRHTLQLKTAATPTKHTPPPVPNRPKTNTFTDTWSRFFHPQKTAAPQESPRP
jgi:hypothetical protein